MKKTLNIFISFQLLIIIAMLSYMIVYPGIKEVVWLIPNDESCSDIWNPKDLDSVIGNYELKVID